MKPVTKFLCAIVLCSLVYVGCKKDTDEELPQPSAPYSVYSLFEKYGAKTQTFQINLDTIHGYAKITGEKGGQIMLRQQSLIAPNNTLVTGLVTIELKEIYDKHDAILSNVPTITANEPLISGGEVFLRVTQNGQELKPMYPFFRLRLPAGNNPDNNMQLYYGKGIQGLGGDTSLANNFSWELDSLGNVYYGDTLNCYYLYPSNFSWINCDHPLINNVNPQPITVTIADTTFKPNNIYAVISIDQINTAINIRNYSNGNITYMGLPAGYNTHIVCIAQKNSQYYFASVPYTVQPTNNNVLITLQLSDENSIVTAINNLP